MVEVGIDKGSQTDSDTVRIRIFSNESSQSDNT